LRLYEACVIRDFRHGVFTVDYDPELNAIVGSYLQVLERQPDIAAVQTLADGMVNKGLSLGTMALSLLTSEEQLQKIGFDITQVDTATQVNQIYLSYLKRLPNPENKNAWIKQLFVKRPLICLIINLNYFLNIIF